MLSRINGYYIFIYFYIPIIFYFETIITKKILFFIIIFNITLELYDIIQNLSRQNTLIFSYGKEYHRNCAAKL